MTDAVAMADAATEAANGADSGGDASRADAAPEAARPDAAGDGARPDGAGPEAAAPDAAAEAEAGIDPFACLGQPLPTTAPATLQIGGITADINQMPIDAVDVQAFIGASTTAAAMTTSVANGTYSLTVSTGGTPVDGYLRASKNGLIDTFFYAPSPVAASTNQAILLLATVQSFTFLAGLANVTPDPTMGTLVVGIVDCLGRPVAGATVDVQPAGTTRYLRNAMPSTAAADTDATGLAAVFNVPAGSVTVGASAGARTLRQHVLNVRANVLTSTSVVP
jgi:hypothetical protein